MSIVRRNPRRFTTAESFRLFMEGVRGLQLHEDEATGDASLQNGNGFIPSKLVLEETLENAYQNLNECAGQYPEDLLPRYYRGIVLGLKAQESQTKQLAEYVSSPSQLPNTCAQADQFLMQAAADFRQVIASARGQLQLYAQYNSAQVMARLNDTDAWINAIGILSRMNLNTPDLSSMPRWKRVLAHVITPFIDQEQIVADFAGRLFRQAAGEQGVMSSLARAKAEQTALRLQVELLKSFLVWRCNSQVRSPASTSFNSTKEDTLRKESEVAVAWLSGFIARIRKSPIPSEAMDDMEADYWNKTAFLLWEQSRNQNEIQYRDLILQQAHTSVTRAMKLSGRKNWTPAQLNLARILLSQGRADEAKKVIDAILGILSIPVPSQVVVPEEGISIDAIAELIVKMAPANNGDAISQAIYTAWGKLDRKTIQRLLLAVAGRVEPVLLNEILPTI
jgi:hypothetical protein